MLFVDFSLMCFCLVFKIVLEIFDMCDSHSYACMCRVVAICCAGLGNCLYVSASCGSSSKETSSAISARVLTLKVPVMLMTIGIILMSAWSVPWFVGYVSVVRIWCRCGL